MAFTYNGPSVSTRDAVRFHLQDITSPGLLSDDEIDYLLLEEKGVYLTVVAGCRVLQMRYVGQPGSKAIGDVSITYADLTTRYAAIEKKFISRASRTSTPIPYLGGLSVADKNANDADGDHVERSFGDGEQWHNEGSTSRRSGGGGLEISIAGGYEGGY